MVTFWFCLGIILIIIEILSFTLWALFFALSSLVVWLLTYLKVIISLEYQLFTFALLSLFFIFLLKNKLKTLLNSGGENVDESTIGKSVICIDDFDKKRNLEGKVEYNGTHWKAISKEAILKGEKAYILKRENITLYITKNK